MTDRKLYSIFELVEGKEYGHLHKVLTYKRIANVLYVKIGDKWEKTEETSHDGYYLEPIKKEVTADLLRTLEKGWYDMKGFNIMPFTDYLIKELGLEG